MIGGWLRAGASVHCMNGVPASFGNGYESYLSRSAEMRECWQIIPFSVGSTENGIIRGIAMVFLFNHL